MIQKTLLAVACVGFLALAGCNRCDMWDWYKECDLIEGRQARNCSPCGPTYVPGQVVRREYAVPVDSDPEPCAAPGAAEAGPAPTNVAPLPPPSVVEPGEMMPAPTSPMPE